MFPFCDENHRIWYDGSHDNSCPQAKLNQPVMNDFNDFGVLTNRKRAVIALIHSIVFLGIAIHGFASPKAGVLLPGSGATGDFILIGIYLTVASILAWLVSIARGASERAYFALCTSSATFGLLRTVFGDTALPPAQYLRVIMLTSAVVVGTWIFLSFPRPVTEDALPD
jgi:hypothetical protein